MKNIRNAVWEVLGKIYVMSVHVCTCIYVVRGGILEEKCGKLTQVETSFSKKSSLKIHRESKATCKISNI